MLALMIATYALIFGWSYLSWALFETPARRIIDRLPLFTAGSRRRPHGGGLTD